MENSISQNKNLCKLKEKINALGGADFNFTGEILLDEPLSNHTTFKVGGNASVFCVPQNKKELLAIINLCSQENVPFFILGGGANLVFSDKGFLGVVISTVALKNVLFEADFVEVESGVTVNEFVETLQKKGLGDFGVFYGLPGTIGGALFMNARCYSHDFCENLLSVEYYDVEEKALKTILYNPKDWGYKKSPFQDKTFVILSGKFAVNYKDCDIIKDEMFSSVNDRIQKGHFKFPSAGSVFKNNRAFEKPTGQIIDELGLKGFLYGGARVAPWHGNIIINEGTASASDIKKLVSIIKENVLDAYGFDLECEIIFVGDFED